MMRVFGPRLFAVMFMCFLVGGVCLSIGARRLVNWDPQQASNSIVNEKDGSAEIVNSEVQQKNIDAKGDVNAAGRDLDVIKGDRVEIHEQHNHYYSISQPELAATREDVKVANRDAEVWVIWRGASWHNGEFRYDEQKLDEFFNSSDYQRALKESDAIACVGMASSWMKNSLRTAPDRDERMRRMSDKRARILCGRVADEMRELGVQPVLLGMGIGFNESKARDLAADRKQRALVPVHVKTGDRTRPASKAEIANVVREVLQKRDLVDFHPHEYSEISNNRPICWFTSEEGVLDLSAIDC